MLTIRICMDGAYSNLEYVDSNANYHFFASRDHRFSAEVPLDVKLPEPAASEPSEATVTAQATPTSEAARQVVELCRIDFHRHGTPIDEEDLRLQAEKYLEYGVPVDQTVRTILRHAGVPHQPLARVEDLDVVLKFGRHKGLRLGDVPTPYLAWLASEPRPDATFLVPEFVRDAAGRIQATRTPRKA